VNTQPFRGAHFATFPPALVERMILAGCPPGGIVADPFMGSGTTARVARKLGRQYIGCDINTEYVAMTRASLDEPFTPPLFPIATVESEVSRAGD
jgi:DNA modification methylase